jgi:hypothetical protein
VLLPAVTEGVDYKPFYGVFGAVLGTKIVTILYKILAEQCNFDIFLIDWEKPKSRQSYTGGA